MKIADLKKILPLALHPLLDMPPQNQTKPAEILSGQIWRVVEPTDAENYDYNSTNPFPSLIVILGQIEHAGELTTFRAAPVFYDIRYCGVQDAIFPREVFFGQEAAVALGCEFTLTNKELGQFAGAMSEEWFDKLADFAEWMETEGKTFPSGLQTGLSVHSP